MRMRRRCYHAIDSLIGYRVLRKLETMCETKNITNGIRKSCLQNVWMPAHGRLQRHITASSIVRVIFCIIMALLSGQIVAYANQIACEARLDFTWMVTRDGLRYGVMLLVFFEMMYRVYRLWGSRLAHDSAISPTTGIRHTIYGVPMVRAAHTSRWHLPPVSMVALYLLVLSENFVVGHGRPDSAI